jgi:hypothetical protein
MPEYEYVLWDGKKFDINSHTFVKEACSAKKWAFASDYIRLYALYTEGGIYLDTDVYVMRSFNDLLGSGFFSAVEFYKENAGKNIELINEDGSLRHPKPAFAGCVNGLQMQAAIMGGVKGHPFLRSCLDWYDGRHFILEDGTYFERTISPEIYAHVAAEYGFRYKNEPQKLKHDMTVYPYAVLAGNVGQAEKDTYAIHLSCGSWRNRTLLARVILALKKNRLLRALFARKESSKKYTSIVR